MIRLRSILLAATMLSLAVPAPAQSISASDRKLGAQQHPEILKEFGGAYSGPGVALVTRVGKTIAVTSGLAQRGDECTVTLLNSTVVNAFAVPGCYIYVTRGLLAIVGDEAELASVLGHEIGHVYARHAQKRQRRSTAASIGSVLASVLLGSAAGQLAGALGQAGVQSYSRGQESEADDLGVRFANAAGYDPYAEADMLDTLGKDEALQAKLVGQSAKDSTPSFARSHPLTRDRIVRATKQAQATGLQPGQKPRGRQAYLAAVDGLLFGDDPGQGYIDGTTFSHPGLRIRFQAPPGFALQNGADAVTLARSDGLKAQFSGGRIGQDGLEGYANRVAQAITGQSGASLIADPVRTTINGLEAYILQLRSGSTDVTVAAYRFDRDSAYSFVALAPAGRASGFDPLIRSFRRLTDPEAAALRPRVVDVVTVRAGDTAQSVANRMAFPDFKLDRFLALNDLDPGAALRPGDQVKIVTYSAR